MTTLDFTNGPGYAALKWDEDANGKSRPDLDVSCICVDGYGVIIDAAYFKNKSLFNNVIAHSGDAKTGCLPGDDEGVVIHVPQLPPHVMFCFITVTRNDSGGGLNVRNSSCRVCDGVVATGNVIEEKKFDSSFGKATGYVFGCFRREGPIWKWDKIDKMGIANNFRAAFFMTNEYLARFIDVAILSGRPRDLNQRFDLSKNEIYGIDPLCKEVCMGLGWDSHCDVDAHCYTFDKNFREKSHIYFGNLKSPGIKHSGDNRTGEGSGDDESIMLSLDQINSDIQYVMFTVQIYSGAPNFQQVKGCYSRMYFKDAYGQTREMCRCSLGGEDSAHGLRAIMCVMQRNHYGWQLESIAETTKIQKLELALKKICGQVHILHLTCVQSKFQPAPPGLQGSITLLGGKNLAAKDKSGTSDPYVKIKGTHNFSYMDDKTQKIKKTLNPTWNHQIQMRKFFPKEKGVLQFFIYDYDRFSGDDPMGIVEMSTDFINQQENKFGAKVKPQKNEQVSGELEFEKKLQKVDEAHNYSLEFPDTKYKTKLVKGRDNAVWNEKKSYKLDEGKHLRCNLMQNLIKRGTINLDLTAMKQCAGEGELEIVLPYDTGIGDAWFKYQVEVDRSLH